MSYKIFKRILDFFVSLTIFVALIPIILVLYILVFLVMGSPVIFKQKRAGQKMNTFSILKFRTMKNKSHKDETDASRLTKLGTFLRKTSLDELPQLINILKGNMSFIGPRPLLVEYNKFYTKQELNRFNVKPGLTGYAEAKGRHMISWDEQFRYDVFYVNNLSFLLDLKIIFNTIPKVLNYSKVSSLNRSDTKRLDVIRSTSNE